MSGHFLDQDFSANVTESGGPPSSGNPFASHAPAVPPQGNQGYNRPTNPPGGAASSGTDDAPPQYDELYPNTNSSSGRQSQKAHVTSESSQQENSGPAPSRPGAHHRGENESYYNSTGLTDASISSGYPPPPAQEQQHYPPPARPPTQQHYEMHNQQSFAQPQQNHQTYPPPTRPPTQQHYDMHNQQSFAQPQQGYQTTPPAPMQSYHDERHNHNGDYPHGQYTNFPPQSSAIAPTMMVPVTGGQPILMVPVSRHDERRLRRFERREDRYQRRQDRWERRHGGGGCGNTRGYSSESD